MATLPQLLAEDIAGLDAALHKLLADSDATAALLIDKGGFLVTSTGVTDQFDCITLAALAAGTFQASETIAGLVRETNFDSVYQQGEKSSLLVMNVNTHCLLVLIFPAEIGIGVVKYYTLRVRERIANQLQTAWARNPEGGLDLSVLNVAETAPLFRKQV